MTSPLLLTDYGPNNKPMTNNGPISLGIGASGQGMYHLPISSYYTITDAIFDVTAITICCTVTVQEHSAAYNTLVAKYDGTNYYAFYIGFSGKLATFVVGSSGVVSIDQTGAIIPLNVETRVAFTYDSVAGLTTYINGVVDGTATAQGTINVVSSPLRIADSPNIPGRYCLADFSDVRIYSKARDDVVKAIADPNQRYELWKPSRVRKYFAPGAAAAFKPVWAVAQNQIIGSGYVS
jgi:hypothetical protein